MIKYDFNRNTTIINTYRRDRVIRDVNAMHEYMRVNRAIRDCHRFVVHSIERVDVSTLPASFNRNDRYYRVEYQFTHIDDDCEIAKTMRHFDDASNRVSLRDAPPHVLFPK